MSSFLDSDSHCRPVRYTPYFFDKKMLDNILEESVDQHFNALIETRNSQRRRDVVDDNLTAEAVEEMNESMWDPPEVQSFIWRSPFATKF